MKFIIIYYHYYLENHVPKLSKMDSQTYNRGLVTCRLNYYSKLDAPNFSISGGKSSDDHPLNPVCSKIILIPSPNFIVIGNVVF